MPYVSPVPEPKTKMALIRLKSLFKRIKPIRRLKDLKILLVEDNLINQKITLLTLKPLVTASILLQTARRHLINLGQQL